VKSIIVKHVATPRTHVSATPRPSTTHYTRF